MVDAASDNRRLDSVSAPDPLQFRERARQEAPLAHHPVHPRVRTHPLDPRRVGVGADPDQLDPGRSRTEELLGVEQRRRREWADGRALRVVEREDDDLAAERTQRDALVELVGQREAGGDGAELDTRVEQRVRLRGGRRERCRRRCSRRTGGRDSCPDADTGDKRNPQNSPVQPAGHFAPVCTATNRGRNSQDRSRGDESSFRFTIGGPPLRRARSPGQAVRPARAAAHRRHPRRGQRRTEGSTPRATGRRNAGLGQCSGMTPSGAMARVSRPELLVFAASDRFDHLADRSRTPANPSQGIRLAGRADSVAVPTRRNEGTR